MELRDALFAALRYELTKTLPEGFSFDAIDEVFLKELYEYSNRQEVAHLVGDALEQLDILVKFSEKVTEPFRRRQAIAAYHAEQQKQALDEVSKSFENAALPYLPLKGLIIRTLYPEPWMRTAGDLDILVKPEDLEKATECLTAIGAKKFKEGPHDRTFVFASQEILELHFQLLEDYRANAAKDALDEIWAHTHAIDGLQYAMEDEWFYYYHLVHMAKHLQTGTCGIRPFLDLWILNHTLPFDREKRRDLLQEYGLFTFATEAERLSEVWLAGKEQDEWTRTLEAFLLAGGTFGSGATAQTMGVYEKKSRFRYYFERIFLPYDSLKRIEPGLEKHPILFPFYQIKRWFRLLFKGRLQREINTAKGAKKLNQNEHSVAELREHLGLLRKDEL